MFCDCVYDLVVRDQYFYISWSRILWLHCVLLGSPFASKSCSRTAVCFLPASQYLRLSDLTSAVNLFCPALTSLLWVTPALHLLQIQLFSMQSITENALFFSSRPRERKKPTCSFILRIFLCVFLFIVTLFFLEFIIENC